MDLQTLIIVTMPGGGTVRYEGATDARVTKRGELLIYKGWRRLASVPDGHWTTSTIYAPGARVPRDEDPGRG